MSSFIQSSSASDSVIMKALRRSVVEGNDVEVQESQDQVVLSGSVPSFYIKQVAQEAVREHVGHRQLQNRLRVLHV